MMCWTMHIHSQKHFKLYQGGIGVSKRQFWLCRVFLKLSDRQLYFQSTGIANYSEHSFSRIIVISFIPMCLMLKYVRWPYSRLCIVWVIRSNVWILDYLVDMKPGVSKNYVTTQECMKHCSIFNCVSNTGYPGHFASAYYCRKKTF